MLTLAHHQKICRQFAALLNYPDSEVATRAMSCAVELVEVSQPASEAVQRFIGFLDDNDSSRIEEAYTGTFELQALCHPYVGYQLCGESQQRTIFMLRMRELYNQHGFHTGNELPDHFCEVLRFIGAIDDPVCRHELIVDGLLPALEKCLEGRAGEQRPYLDLVLGLKLFLAETATYPSEAGRETTALQKEYLS